MAIKYNNSNNLKEIVFNGEDSPNLVIYQKLINGVITNVNANDTGYVWAKPFTLQINSTQWDKVKKVSVTISNKKEPTSSSEEYTTFSGNITKTIYYGERVEVVIETLDGYHFGESEATDDEENHNTVTSPFVFTSVDNDWQVNVPTIQFNKNLVTISREAYNENTHMGHISDCWLDIDSHSTTVGSSNGYYEYGKTVYAYVKLRDDGALSIPSEWGNPISGVAGKKDAIYCVGSKQVQAYSGYDFETKSLSTPRYTLTFSNSGYTSWNATSSIEVYWGDRISQSGNTFTITHGDYNSFSPITRTYSYDHYSPGVYYYYNETFSPSVVPTLISSSIAFSLSNERKKKRITITMSSLGNSCRVGLDASVNGTNIKTIDAGDTLDMYFMYNNNYYNNTGSSYDVTISGNSYTFAYYSNTIFNSRTWRIYKCSTSNFMASVNNVETEDITLTFSGVVSPSLSVRQKDDYFEFMVVSDYDEESGTYYTSQRLYNRSNERLYTTLRTKQTQSGTAYQNSNWIYPGGYVETSGSFNSGYYWIQFRYEDDTTIYIKPWQNNETLDSGDSFTEETYHIYWRDRGFSF